MLERKSSLFPLSKTLPTSWIITQIMCPTFLLENCIYCRCVSTNRCSSKKDDPILMSSNEMSKSPKNKGIQFTSDKFSCHLVKFCLLRHTLNHYTLAVVYSINNKLFALALRLQCASFIHKFSYPLTRLIFYHHGGKHFWSIHASQMMVLAGILRPQSRNYIIVEK